MSKKTTSDRKPPRNRTLLESVQKHLTLGSRAHSSGNEMLPEKRPHRQEITRGESSQLRGSSAVPSLLARMSDASHAVALPEPVSVMPSNNITGGLPTFEPAVGVQTRMSAPQIMARTRARLVKNDEVSSQSLHGIQSQTENSSLSHSDGRQDTHPASSGAIANLHPGPDAQYLETRFDTNASHADIASSSKAQNNSSQRTHIARAGRGTTDDGADPAHQLPISRMSANLPHRISPKNHSHVEPPSSVGHSPIGTSNSPANTAHIKNLSHPPVIDARTRLLFRLEEEKHQAHRGSPTTIKDSLPEVSSLDRTFRERGSRSLPPATEVPVASEIDPHVLEAKLRTRAQLQVRLAAEKRSNGT